MIANKPIFTVLYNNKNITADLAKFLLSLTYNDKVAGESDEVEIELEDTDGLWRNNWYPEKGAKLTVSIGQLKCGVFEIDEIELKGPPDTVTIRGIATGITNSLRTKKSDAHENKTLKQIAEKVATKNGLTIQGAVPEITLERVTQNQETDLGFLKRVAAKFGVVFSVRDKVITFMSVFDLEARGSSFTVDKSEIAGYSLKDKADGMVKSAKVKSKNAKNNESVTADLDFEKYKKDNPTYTGDTTTSGNEGVSHEPVENTQQAEAVAKAIMHLSASNQQEGTISMEFNPLACAGNNFTITGLGKLAGRYHIKASSHKVDKDAGSTSECQVKRIQLPTKVQQASVKKKKEQPKSVRVASTAVSSSIAGYTQTPGNTGKVKV